MKLPSMQPKRGMTKGDVGVVLGVSIPTVTKLIVTGRLRAVQISETSIRVLPEDLEAFIHANETAPKASTLALLR